MSTTGSQSSGETEIGSGFTDRLAAALGLLRRILWVVVNSYRFLTPHYWRTRALRDEIASEIQTLLPAPYDPYALELECRARPRPALADKLASGDQVWAPLHEKLAAKALDQRLGTIGAIEIGGWMIHDVHSAFASIDQDFMTGVSLRAGHAIHSFSALSERLGPHTLGERIAAVFSAPNADSPSLRPLVGSVGEATVLRHLHEADINAHAAAIPNQPGWDIDWNHHVVNVKTWADASGLWQHFDKYPDIPTVVPGDAAGIPQHALHFDPSTGHGLQAAHDALAAGTHHLVIADDSLSSAAIHDHVERADTLLTGSHETVHLHLPYITMALSGTREIGLLLNGKTDLGSAAKNLSLDSAGTGVGGALGAKIGAGIGTIILPGFGTAIGGIVGGVLGAKKGRAWTTEIKQKPFKEAVTAYEVARSNFEIEAKARESEASTEMDGERAVEQEHLTGCAREATQAIQEAHDALISWIAYDSALQPDEACALIDRSLQEIANMRNRIEAHYQNVPWWKKWAWPDAATLAQQEAISFVRRVQRRLAGMRVAAQRGQATNRGQLMSLLGAVGVMETQIRDFLAAIYAAQEERERQAQQIIAEAMAKVGQERRLAEARLMAKSDVVFARLREAMEPILRRLNEQTEALKHEGAKLGMTL